MSEPLVRGAAPTPRLLDNRPSRTRSAIPWLLGIGLLVASVLGYRALPTDTSPTDSVASSEFVEPDVGDVSLYVYESGTLESARNTLVLCEVEALLGIVTEGETGGPSGSGGSSGSSSGTTGAGSTAAASTAAASTVNPTQARLGTTETSTASASLGIARPTIRSFTYIVPAYTPMRTGARSTSGGSSQQSQAATPQQSRGRSDMMADQAVSGSTRILSILPEGTQVKASQVVCELDSAALRDELEIQAIRVDQARSWTEQAERILEVAQIDLREYRDGLLPQDAMAIANYITQCRTQLTQTSRNLEWARNAFENGLLNEAQFRAERINHTRAQLALDEGFKMRQRLDAHTTPKLIKALESRIAAAEADLLTQKQALQSELDRLERIETNIDRCIIRAPHEGVVIYYKKTSWSGRLDFIIEEGQYLYERQPIFFLPDFSQFRVEVRVNESQIKHVQMGQTAWVRLDAFPNRALTGQITKINPIATEVGTTSSVQFFEVEVEVQMGDYSDLKPGLSAQVAIHVETRRDVPRIPLTAIRWADRRPFVAVPETEGYRWQELTLGLRSQTHAEILSGLEPGTRVLPHPEDLPRRPDTGTETEPLRVAKR